MFIQATTSSISKGDKVVKQHFSPTSGDDHVVMLYGQTNVPLYLQSLVKKVPLDMKGCFVIVNSDLVIHG